MSVKQSNLLSLIMVIGSSALSLQRCSDSLKLHLRRSWLHTA